MSHKSCPREATWTHGFRHPTARQQLRWGSHTASALTHLPPCEHRPSRPRGAVLENRNQENTKYQILFTFLLIRQYSSQRNIPNLYASPLFFSFLFFFNQYLTAVKYEAWEDMQTAALKTPGSSTARGLTKPEALEYCKEDQKRFAD